MYQSATRKFKACALTARQLITVYRQNPSADYATVLKTIETASGGKISEQVLLEMAEFVATQMGGLQGDPLLGDTITKYDQSSFVAELKHRARTLVL